MSTKLLETIKDVHAAFATAGYGTIRPNTKTHGYKSPRGRIVYLSLSQTRPPWRLAVHPDTSMDVLRVAGIEIADKLYHGSNMREFPKERHGGQKPIPCGRRLIVHEDAALETLLHNIDETE